MPKNFIEEAVREFEKLWVLPTDFTPSEGEPIYDLDKREQEIKSFLRSTLLAHRLEVIEERDKDWRTAIGSVCDPIVLHQIKNALEALKSTK